MFFWGSFLFVKGRLYHQNGILKQEPVWGFVMNKIIFCILILMIFSNNVHALRCGHSLVQIGDRKNDVLAKCGDPDSVDQHVETRVLQNYANIGSGRLYSNNGLVLGQQHYSEVQIIVDEWVYDFGRSRFQQYLRFENGVLTNMSDLGRGR